MKIIRDEKLATLTLVPIGQNETEIITSITEILKPGDKLSYGGRGSDGNDNKFCIVHLHAGAREERQNKTVGSTTFWHSVHVGGVHLVLRGSTENDKSEVGRIRDACFFGAGGLIYIGETELNKTKSIITTAMRCEHCNSNMLERVECEWRTCNACAAKCMHDYERGPIHGGGIDIGVGEFCSKCGRGKPKTKGERKKSLIEHHLAVGKELGINVIYKDSFLKTPRQAAIFERLMRRFDKSKRRTANSNI